MRVLLYLLLLFFILFVLSPIELFAADIEPGQPVPSFDLRLINSDGFLTSRDLFSAYRHTFILFWDRTCAHCVEVLRECEAFYQEHTAGEIEVVGIHSDEAALLEIEGLLDAYEITFPQLCDVAGGVAQSYGVPHATAALFLINGNGRMIESIMDPEGDIGAMMRRMLSNGREVIEGDLRAEETYEAAPSGAPGTSGFVFHGTERIRFLAVDASGVGTVGPYGEVVNPGNNVHMRLEFDMSRRFGRHLSIGGLLRISNEGEEVLEAGPEYLSYEWGSAYAEISTGRAALRLGYYSIRMTPLTLMRWDWDDNPRTGGDASCGCGAGAGVLLIESLEELGPDLFFEGAVGVYSRSNFEVRLFYAIPRRPRETSYREVRSTGAERARYSLEIYGFESLWQRYDARTGSFWKAGVHLAGSWENRRSVDFIALGYAAPDPWYESTILTASWQVPVIRSVGLRGEWVLWNRADGHGLDLVYGQDHVKWDGYGGIAGIIFERSPRFSLKCDYLRLSTGFYSPFAALSYVPNREGGRFSSRLLLPGGIAAVSVFYKRLQEREVPIRGAEKEQESFFGASFDLDLPNGFGGSLGWLDRGTWRSGGAEPMDEVRRAFALSVRYRLNKNSLIQAQYQRVDASVKFPGSWEQESLTNLYSVYLSTIF